MKLLQAKRAALADAQARLRSLLETDPADDAAAQEMIAQSKALTEEVGTLETEIEGLASLESLRAKSGASARPAMTVTDKAELRDIEQLVAEKARENDRADSRARLLARGTAFARPGVSKAEAAESAYRFGMWIFGALGNQKAAKFCADNGILLRAQTESSNAGGGYLVPEEFEATLIDLREQYGVFRQHANVVPMTSDTKSVPRRTGGLTAYFVGENTAITESTLGWDRVSLTARKMAVLGKYSSEFGEDAVINIANTLADEIAYAFANKEDLCGFNGDGTSTYGAITGVREKIKGLSGTIAYIAGLVVGTGNAYSELTLADFEGVVAKLPQYADGANARWFAHRSFYWNVMVKLMLASGGVTQAEVSALGRQVPFLGYPVAVSQVLPSVEANSQVCALFGDLRRAAMLGDRRQTTIAMSEHLNFAEDELAVRGTQRFDIVVHDVGNADSTAANRVPGPIVGLITAAS